MTENTLISRLGKGRSGFFDMLWKRMSEKGDFPALSSAAQEIAEAMHDEDRNASELTTAILSDFALTQKVIRLANSAMYSALGGEITTITKAVLVLGVDAIGHLALSVRLMDTLSASVPDSPTAKAEMAKSLLAGSIAHGIASKANLRDAEEVVVCALMHHLGRLLIAFYFPEEWEDIAKLAGGQLDAENEAAKKVIGISLDEIAQESAKRWRLPAKIANSMARPKDAVAPSIPGSAEWINLVASFSGEAAAMAAEGKSGLDRLVGKYGDALLVPLEAISESVESAVSLARETALLEEGESWTEGKPQNAGDRLASGLEGFSSALKEGLSFGNALNLALETLYLSMGFNRVVAILRDGDTLKGRVGFGHGMPEMLPRLVLPESAVPDLFRLALQNNADIFIEDVADPKISEKLPAWFGTALTDVQSFVLLPMSFNNHPVGALYGDWGRGTSYSVEKSELALMRSLRDQLMGILSPAKK